MDNVLKHHGITGMKWGVRRSDAQLGGGSEDSGGSQKPKTGSSSSFKGSNHLSDEELRSRVTRLNMEKQYRDLNASLTPQKKHTVLKLIGDAGLNFAKQSMNKIVEKAVAKTFSEKEFNIKKIDFKDPSKIRQAELSDAVKWFSSEKLYEKLKTEYDSSHP